MVRKAIVKDLCDKCLDDTSQELETDADYCLVFRLNEGDEVAVDLCTMHADALSVSEMVKMSRAMKPVKSDKQTRDKLPCRFCGKSYSSGSGMALHIKSAHQEEANKHKVIV